MSPETIQNAIRQNLISKYSDALVEISDVLEDDRADDAEKLRTIRRILRAIGMTAPKA